MKKVSLTTIDSFIILTIKFYPSEKLSKFMSPFG